MNPVDRKYNVSDSSMLEHNKTMLQHFTDEQAAFSAFDADFANPFETDWETAISTAEAHATDETILDQLQQLTNDVEDAMEAARNKFQQSKYFIEKAFPDKPAVQNEFGFDNYKPQRKSQTGMIQFMHTFFATATKYTAELASVGYDAAAVAEIESLLVDLDKANNKQEKFKGTRLVLTEDRKKDMNKAWDTMVRVSKAGKTIFVNDPAKYQLFLLPASSETGEDISISGTVTAADTTPLEGAEVSIAALSITVTTDSNGNYAMGQVPDGTYTLDFSAVGYQPQSVADVVVEEGTTTDMDVTLTPTL